MRLPTPDPRQLRDLASSGLRTGRDVFGAVPRIESLLDTAEVVLERLAALVTRLEAMEVLAQVVIQRVDDARERAETAITRVAAIGERANRVFDEWVPTLDRGRPLAARLVETWGTAEADALTAAVHGGSRLNEQLENELIPVVETLKTVAPDLAELVTTSKALNEIIGTVPGLGRAKKRAEQGSEPAEPAADR